MSEQFMFKALQFSAVIFGLAGFLIGVVLFGQVATGVAFMGALFGAIVGIVAAINCLIINHRARASVVSLLFNLFLFIIIAREMQVIG